MRWRWLGWIGSATRSVDVSHMGERLRLLRAALARVLAELDSIIDEERRRK